jgi:hypothetical protein
MVGIAMLDRAAGGRAPSCHRAGVVQESGSPSRNEGAMTPTPESFVLIAFAVLGLMLLAGIASRLNGMRSQIAVLSRIEAKLDLLLKQANIKFDPYANVSREIAEAVRAGQIIKAIKLHRESTGVGLKEAKEYIEGVQRRGGVA